MKNKVLSYISLQKKLFFSFILLCSFLLGIPTFAKSTTASPESKQKELEITSEFHSKIEKASSFNLDALTNKLTTNSEFPLRLLKKLPKVSFATFEILLAQTPVGRSPPHYF